MTILASVPVKGKKVTCEVLDVWTGGSGVKLATVRALAGSPFMSWTHGGWCASDTCNFPADLLGDLQKVEDPEPSKPNLFDLAMTHQDKRQWYSGEVVTLVNKNGRPGAFLKNDGRGLVNLHLTGYTPSLCVFVLREDGWTLHPQAKDKYHFWASKAKAALGGK